MRMGRTSARLRLGHGHLAELVRSLGMSAQPVQALVETSLQLRDQAYDRLEPVERPSLSPTKPNPAAAPMIITNEDGSEETVNQLPEGLPFDASADFELTSTA